MDQTIFLFVTVATAVQITGLSRSTIYNALKAGSLKAKHCGRRTVLCMDSIRAFMASLPDYEPAVGSAV